MRIRVGCEMTVRARASHAHDRDPQCALVASVRLERPRLPDHNPIRARGGIAGQLQEVVKPSRCPGWYDHAQNRNRGPRQQAGRDSADPGAEQIQIQNLPAETLLYLLGSRYCETDRLSDVAWSLFGSAPLGWVRVQAICDYVHDHITFGYEHSRATRTAFGAF